MEIYLFFTELQPFKLTHVVILGSFLHYRARSLCNQLPSQFSVDLLQTLHTLCDHILYFISLLLLLLLFVFCFFVFFFAFYPHFGQLFNKKKRKKKDKEKEKKENAQGRSGEMGRFIKVYPRMM